eukprot:1190515-Prorocentrum_minimum.AAC.3
MRSLRWAPPVVATQRHGRGAPGPSCSSWCSHRAHPPSGAGYSSSGQHRCCYLVIDVIEVGP